MHQMHKLPDAFVGKKKCEEPMSEAAIIKPLLNSGNIIPFQHLSF